MITHVLQNALSGAFLFGSVAPMKHGKITDYSPDANNANKGTPRGLQTIEDSLQRLGAGRSIVVDKDGNVIAGNKTQAAAVNAGLEDVIEVETDGNQLVVVKRTDISIHDAKGKALAIADNRASELSMEWDNEMLGALLADIGAQDARLVQAAGFEAAEVSELLAKLDTPKEDAGAQVDRADELLAKWQVERGQLWTVGDHRLLCGDSTNADDVARLMAGERARVVATSPPYADQRDYEIGDFNWHELMSGVFASIISVVGDPADILINLGMSHKDGRVNRYYDKWIDDCEALGYPLYGWYVWDKGSGFPGEWNGRLAPAHEFVFHFSVGRVSARKWVETTGESAKRGANGKRFRKKDGALKEVYSPDTIGQPFKVPDSVIRINREMARGVHTQNHPAVFSVEFAEFLIRTWSDADNCVLEPFGGSGTTMVACEQLRRRCRMLEIEPKYVAVILERMSAMGLKPELIEQNE